MTSRSQLWLTVLTAAGLGVLGWRWWQPRPAAIDTAAAVTLWTAGAVSTGESSGRHLALPDAEGAPTGAERIVDLSSLRRRFPALASVRIEGDGVDETAAEALNGLVVTWQRPKSEPAREPAIVALSFPRQLSVGQRLRVQGRVSGLPPDAPLMLSLEGSDGASQTQEVRAASDGEAAWTLTSASAAVAPGAFEWKLRLGPKGAPLVLGAMVMPPRLPRVLFLQPAPNGEAGRLQRWLATAGAPVTSRTRVSAESARFASANDAPAEFAVLNAAVLGNFDVIITRLAALRELSLEESAALERAVREQGVGLLVVGTTDAPAELAALFPWKLRSLSAEPGDNDARLARIRLALGTEIAEPASVPSVEIAPPAGAVVLARDSQDRPLTAAIRRDRGWVAGTIVDESWRWLQGGQVEAYASYWSAVLSALARPVEAAADWTVEPATGPILAGQRVALGLSLGAQEPLPAATILRLGEQPTSTRPVRLVREAREPTRLRAFVWPEAAGWHEVRVAPNGPAFSFHVLAADALPARTRQERWDATARLVERSAAESPPLPVSNASLTKLTVDLAWLAFFVAGAGWLWLRERKV